MNKVFWTAEKRKNHVSATWFIINTKTERFANHILEHPLWLSRAGGKTIYGFMTDTEIEDCSKQILKDLGVPKWLLHIREVQESDLIDIDSFKTHYPRPCGHEFYYCLTRVYDGKTPHYEIWNDDDDNTFTDVVCDCSRWCGLKTLQR
jgi:hypothetical protein